MNLEKLEEELIKNLEEKIINLEETKLEKIEKMKEEQKISIGKETLNKRKEEAMEEIKNHGEGSKEASEDLEKINEELEKIDMAEKEIEKKVTSEIRRAKRNLTEANKLIEQKENIKKDIDTDKKSIQRLEKLKEEALAEIKNHGEGSKEASEDVGKIEKELEEKNNKLADKQGELDSVKIQITKLIEKNGIKLEEEKQEEKAEETKMDEVKDEEKEETINKEEDLDIENIEDGLNKEADKIIENSETVKPQSQVTEVKTTKKENQTIPSQTPSKEKIVGIEIKEGSDIINIIVENEGKERKNYKIENVLEKTLKDKKRIFAEPKIAEIIRIAEPSSRIKRFFLKRRLNPVILDALNDNEQISTMIDYIAAVRNKTEVDGLEIKHDLSHSILKGRQKRMMQRIAKTEDKIEGMEVVGLEKNKISGMLEAGKRKLKNHPMKTLKAKFTGKTNIVTKAKTNAKKMFKSAIRVSSKVLTKYAETYGEEDLNRLESNDPDLEETEPKAQENEEQER